MLSDNEIFKARMADKNAVKYFESLPTNVQELIMQSGANIKTEQDLRNCAENLTKGK